MSLSAGEHLTLEFPAIVLAYDPAMVNHPTEKPNWSISVLIDNRHSLKELGSGTIRRFSVSTDCRLDIAGLGLHDFAKVIAIKVKMRATI